MDIVVKERKSSLAAYSECLEGCLKDPNFEQYTRKIGELQDFLKRKGRLELAKQQGSEFDQLVQDAASLWDKYGKFLHELAGRTCGDDKKATAATVAPLKGGWRALEKMVLQPRPEGSSGPREANLDASKLLDILRGSLKCKDFNELSMAVSWLEKFDSDLGKDEEGQDKMDKETLDLFGRIKILRVKERFGEPTSGGWADLLINFVFEDDNSKHVIELQLQHEQMLAVRSGGKAHTAYNRFRSAYELLETIGKEKEVPAYDYTLPRQQTQGQAQAQTQGKKKARLFGKNKVAPAPGDAQADAGASQAEADTSRVPSPVPEGQEGAPGRGEVEITELDQLGGPEEQDEEQEGVQPGAVPPAAGAEEAEADAGAGLGTPAPQAE